MAIAASAMKRDTEAIVRGRLQNALRWRLAFIIELVILALTLVAILADVRGCVCDPLQPDTLQARVCSLTLMATKQPETPFVFFVRDANPTKPNRWLAIPHALHRTLSDMTAEERTELWSAAIAKARSLWNDQWAIAVNSEEKRTQCQLHAHIGKLVPSADSSGGVVVSRAEEIPTPEAGQGIWLQPEGNRFRVHPGEPAGELNLVR